MKYKWSIDEVWWNAKYDSTTAVNSKETKVVRLQATGISKSLYLSIVKKQCNVDAKCKCNT